MTKVKKNLLSVCTIFIFSVLAIGSAVNKIHMGAFNTSKSTEKETDNRDYLLKNDGTKIYGNKVTWKSGLLTKDQISIDDQKFKIPDIMGYKSEGLYYGRLGKEYIQRIIHGKLNVYIQYTEVTSNSVSTSGSVRSRSYTRTDHYAQRGPDGEMIGIPGQKEIGKLVKDCPLAFEMIDISNSKVRKAIKKDRNFLNSIFEIYNNDCKPL